MLFSGALRSRRWVWLALCVFTLSAWMPTLSAWVAHASGFANVAPVCQAQDTTWAQPGLLATQDDGNPSAPMADKGHCPFCLSQHHTPVLPPPSLAAMAVLDNGLSQQLPAALLHAPRTQHVWSPAAARAPPLVA